MELLKLVESYKEDIVKSTQDIIKIKSVEDEAKPGMPFGKGVNQALESALELGKQMGFKVENFDGYAGHADLGDGEEVIGILAHLDVVPEGEGWTYPPYGGEIHDGKIYGRGTIDDKGPAIAAMYAMKALKMSGVSLSKKIRIIFGTNEESSWKGINYYLDKVKAPDMAFTPDADFPVIHGEKGILMFNLTKDLNVNNDGDIKIKSIKGGHRANMVPDSCTVIIDVEDNKKEYIIEKLKQYINETGYEIYLEEKEDLIITSKGKSAHGSLPQSGKNAISQLMIFLSKLEGIIGDIKDFIDTYSEKIGMEYNGQSIGCGLEDEESGKLTFNVGVIEINDNKADLTVNVRYPITYNSETVYNGMRDALKETGIELKEEEDMKPIYMPVDHPLVEKLMNVYREITGDTETKPITIGGGTYARAMENAVAFGPLFPGQEELAHQKDEYIGIDDLIKSTKIYAKALYELAK